MADEHSSLAHFVPSSETTVVEPEKKKRKFTTTTTATLEQEHEASTTISPSVSCYSIAIANRNTGKATKTQPKLLEEDSMINIDIDDNIRHYNSKHNSRGDEGADFKGLNSTVGGSSSWNLFEDGVALSKLIEFLPFESVLNLMETCKDVKDKIVKAHDRGSILEKLCKNQEISVTSVSVLVKLRSILREYKFSASRVPTAFKLKVNIEEVSSCFSMKHWVGPCASHFKRNTFVNCSFTRRNLIEMAMNCSEVELINCKVEDPKDEGEKRNDFVPIVRRNNKKNNDINNLLRFAKIETLTIGWMKKNQLDNPLSALMNGVNLSNLKRIEFRQGISLEETILVTTLKSRFPNALQEISADLPIYSRLFQEDFQRYSFRHLSVFSDKHFWEKSGIQIHQTSAKYLHVDNVNYHHDIENENVFMNVTELVIENMSMILMDYNTSLNKVFRTYKNENLLKILQALFKKFPNLETLTLPESIIDSSFGNTSKDDEVFVFPEEVLKWPSLKHFTILRSKNSNTILLKCLFKEISMYIPTLQKTELKYSNRVHEKINTSEEADLIGLFSRGVTTIIGEVLNEAQIDTGVRNRWEKIHSPVYEKFYKKLFHCYYQLLNWIIICPDVKKNKRMIQDFISACCLHPNSHTSRRLASLNDNIVEFDLFKTHVNDKIKTRMNMALVYEACVGEDDELFKRSQKLIREIECLLEKVKRADFQVIQFKDHGAESFLMGSEKEKNQAKINELLLILDSCIREMESQTSELRAYTGDKLLRPHTWVTEDCIDIFSNDVYFFM